MSSVLDHTSEAGKAELVRLAGLYELPDFVKKADFTKVCDGSVPRTSYADAVHRRLPCDSAASTWLSALFFHEKRAEYPKAACQKVEGCLDEFVRYWRIKAAVDKMVAQHAGYVKEAEAELPDSAFGFVWVDDRTGAKERQLRMVNSNEVKAAADYLFTYRDEFRFRDRHVMAKKVLEKAAKFGTGLGERREFLERQAGRGVCDPAEVLSMLQGRAKLAADNKRLSDAINATYHVVRKNPACLEPDSLVKLAETVDGIDHDLHLVGKYTDLIRRPEDVIFKATFTKVASEIAEHCSTTSGSVYRKEDFAKLALDDLSAVFGSDFAEEVKHGFSGVDPEKMAEIVSTLPRPEAQLLDGIMAEAGLAPAMSKSASARHGLSDETLRALAETYG